MIRPERGSLVERYLMGVTAVVVLGFAACGGNSAAGGGVAGSRGVGSGGSQASGGAPAFDASVIKDGPSMGSGGLSGTGGQSAGNPDGAVTDLSPAETPPGSGGGAAGGAIADGGMRDVSSGSGGGAGIGGVGGVGGARLTGGRGGGAGGRDQAARALDLLFMIDNSQSMAVMQQKLAEKLPQFMDVLKGIPGGLPDLHVAVISSSLSAGIFSNVPGCAPDGPGDQNGAFQGAATCSALHQGQKFISTANGVNNFDGDISAVFACMAMLGDHGCGFEHQFESTRVALQRAMDPTDPDNAGFLRSNAALAIVMLTNEDDCSAPADSDLFDPTQQLLSDMYGGLNSYRCNQFGHLCGGVAPPSSPGNYTLTGCTSAEESGRLTTVKAFVTFLKGLKGQDPSKLLVAALAGPAEPYAIQPQTFQLGTGAVEEQPAIVHSCTRSPIEYADPAVRIKAWTDSFGDNGIFESICPADFGPALKRIADGISRMVGP